MDLNLRWHKTDGGVFFLGGSRTSTYSPPGDCVHSVGVGFSCSPMGSSR